MNRPSIWFYLVRRYAGRFIDWLSGFVRMVIAVALLAAFGVSAAVLLPSLPKTIKSIIHWEKDTDLRRFGSASGRLFEKLSRKEDNAIITYLPDKFALNLAVNCAQRSAGFDIGLLPGQENGLGGSKKADTLEDADKLLDRLCRTDPGALIRKELARFRNTKEIIAVRDNRKRHSRLCDDGSSVGANYVRSGCFANRWRVGIGQGRDFQEVDSSRQAVPSINVFGFIAHIAAKGNGDWLNIDPAFARGSPVILRTVIDWRDRTERPASAYLLDIDVVGEVTEIRVNQRKRQIFSASRRTSYTGKAYCDRISGGTGRCKNDPVSRAEKRSRVHRINLQLGRGLQLIEIAVKPASAIPAELRRLNDANMEERDYQDLTAFIVDQRYLLTNHVLLDCRLASGETTFGQLGASADSDSYFTIEDGITKTVTAKNCRLGWRSVVNGRPNRAGLLHVNLNNEAGEQVRLTCTQEDPDGTQFSRVNQFASKIGLVPIIGFDHRDELSLIGQLEPQVVEGKTREIDLSIDPRFQETAIGVLSDVLNRKAGLKRIWKLLPKNKNRSRRASIVLLDAGPISGAAADEHTGRILAAATLPKPGSGYSEWDLRALEQYRPAQSPVASRAWAKGGRFFAAGSSFKPLVALAAADSAARQGNEIKLAFAHDGGGVTSGNIARLFDPMYLAGIQSSTLLIPTGNSFRNGTGKIKNFSGNSLCSSVGRNCGANARLSMKNAIKQSSNLWFGALALALDDTAVTCVDAGGRLQEIRRNRQLSCTTIDGSPATSLRRPLILKEVADHLFGGNDLRLMRAIESPKFRIRAQGARVMAEGIQLDAAVNSRPRRFSLALNGIGQAMQASPLAIAAISGAIGSGYQLHPRLTRRSLREDHRDVIPEVSESRGIRDRQLADAYLQEIRNGMKAVIRESGGTANSEFSRHKKLVGKTFGKTGTAQVGGKDRPGNSAWFMGWVEGVGKGQYAGRRIAFACVVTHVSKTATAATGGRICAPIIAETLMRLERLAAEPKQPGEVAASSGQTSSRMCSPYQRIKRDPS